MTEDEIQERLKICQALLASITATNPNEVLVTILDQLVELSCGANPALRSLMRMKFYEAVCEKLSRNLFPRLGERSES